MWETIKNDPILKTVTIIILSVLGFGFAFNIMFGPNNSGMEHGHGSGGYSLGNTLSYIFILAFKILLIVLVIAVILAVIRLARKHLSEGGEIKVFDSIKKDPVLKVITVVVLLIVAFGLIYYLLSGLFGFGSGFGMMNGYNSYNMMGNAGYGLGLSGLLAILLKLLLVASLIGLFVGLVMFIKQSYGKEIGEKVKEECTSCGAELKKEWKCCPVCGTERGDKEQ